MYFNTKKQFRVVALTIVMFLLLSLHSYRMNLAYAADDQDVRAPIVLKVNGASLLSDIPEFLQGGRIMVPLRTVSEAMGAKVTWDAAKRTALVVKGKHGFEVAANEVKAKKDGRLVILDSAPMMREGRLFIPLRFSVEGLGGTIRWNQTLKEASIFPNLTPEKAQREVKKIAEQVIHSLQDQDFETLAKLSHPSGVTFSPYAYVNRTKDITLSAQSLSEGFTNQRIYEWGSFDGSGKPISMDFETYYKRFVYSEDFAKAPFVGYNESLSYGNTLNNASMQYPDAVMVEYHFDGFNPDYAGIDWRSLRLVFQQESGNWLLSGVINDEWTI
ncbi:copper amine oxidase N-terminal domain-containing protein [Paenibacillus sp. EC2-1]|uniref:copper amine oxidase N-terminal domain-containing protein n=1 Tax=Paenibacillus sp. EC2-1 TaxID=3388665 RepID=UPI003BEEFACB